MFFKKAVVERFTVSIGKDLCQSLFSYKVEVVRPAILFFEKRLRYRYFLFTFSIIFQKSFFTEHLRTKALKKRPQLLNLWRKKRLVVIYDNFVFLFVIIARPSEEELDDFREEIEMMKTIGYHKNIVNLVGCSTKREPLCLVVEFMRYGDLLNYLRQRRSKVSINTMSLNFNSVHGFQKLCVVKFVDSL